MALYRDFQTQAEIDAQYDAARTVPDMAAVAELLAANSARIGRALPRHAGLAYGPTRDEVLDVFPAARPGAPVLVFIHGGYWRAYSNRDFNLVAAGPAARGWTVVTTNYSLCPKVGIAEITRQSRAAVKWVHDNIAGYNGDPARICVAGHSAGGQQIGMLLATDWAGEYALPESPFAGAVAVSGVFDLRPLRYSYLQPLLQLDGDLVERESPIDNVRRCAAPLLVTAGAGETSELQRQSRAYHRAWTAAGNRGELWLQPAANHFDTVTAFMDPDSALCERLQALIA